MALEMAFGTVVRHGLEPGADDSLAADRRVSDPHGSAVLPRREHERRAVAGPILLARRLHAALPFRRHGRASDHADADARADTDVVVGQLHHAHPRRPRVRQERHRAAARRRRAALVRRDDRFLGRRCADHLDVEHPGLDVARPVRVLEQDADDRDLHAESRCGRQLRRLESRDDVLRSRSARRADPHRAQLRRSRATSTKATHTFSRSACRRSIPSRAAQRPSRRGTSSSTKCPTCTAAPGRRSGRSTSRKGCRRRKKRTSSASTDARNASRSRGRSVIMQLVPPLQIPS